MNLINLLDLNGIQIRDLMGIADSISCDSSSLSGKTVVLFFPESSIRTRVTFEKGIRELGGQAILFPSSTLDKAEELRDVIGYLENWADLVIIRHGDIEKIAEIGRHARIPVINAMSSHNHPCEILSDIYSVRRLRVEYRDLHYTFVGPRGNILQSWVNLARVLGLSFCHVGPRGERMEEEGPNYRFHEELEPALRKTDVLLTDSLPAGYKSSVYYERYQIREEHLMLLREDALINPCPPFFRGQEIASEVIDSRFFVGYRFKKTLLELHKAVMKYCLEPDDRNSRAFRIQEEGNT